MFFFCSNRFSKRRGIFDTFDTPEKLGAERVDCRKHLFPTPKLHGCAVAVPRSLGQGTVSRRTTIFIFIFIFVVIFIFISILLLGAQLSQTLDCQPQSACQQRCVSRACVCVCARAHACVRSDTACAQED
jgi:hypothetical protein